MASLILSMLLCQLAADGRARTSLALERYFEIVIRLAHEDASAKTEPQMQQYYRGTGQLSGWTADDLQKHREALSPSDKREAQNALKQRAAAMLDMSNRIATESGRKGFAHQAEYFQRELKLLGGSGDDKPSANLARTGAGTNPDARIGGSAGNKPTHMPATGPEWLDATRKAAESAEPIPPLDLKNEQAATQSARDVGSRLPSSARVIDERDEQQRELGRYEVFSKYEKELSSIIVDECERQFPGVQLTGQAKVWFENRRRGSRQALDALRSQLDDFHVEQAIRKHTMSVDSHKRLIADWRNDHNHPDKIVCDHWKVSLSETQQELDKLRKRGKQVKYVVIANKRNAESWSNAENLATHPDVTAIDDEELEPLAGQGARSKQLLADAQEVVILEHSRGLEDFSGLVVTSAIDGPRSLARKLIDHGLKEGTPVELIVCNAGSEIFDTPNEPQTFAGQMAAGLGWAVTAYPHYVRLRTRLCADSLYHGCLAASVSGYRYMDGLYKREEIPVNPVIRRSYLPNGTWIENKGAPNALKVNNLRPLGE